MKKLLFGTAGIPISTTKPSSVNGIAKVRKLNLDCMELEFVRGVRMSEASAMEVKKAAKEHKIELSAHGPYYINLNSKEIKKKKASVQRILKTARIGNLCGASTCTFHAAYYMNMEPSKVYETVKKELSGIVQTLKSENNKIWIRPETTGKGTQFGTLEEILNLSRELDHVMPCVDFAHMHARTNKLNTKEEFKKILEQIEKKLGRKGLDNMHIHMSGVEYTKKGERNHLVLKESDFKWHELLKVWKEFRIKGLVISESPNIERDARLMQKYYSSL